MAVPTPAAARPDYEACSGCSVCRLPCPVWRETLDPLLTLVGRAKALQGGASAAEVEESLWACVLCGACEAVCPEGLDTVGLTLRLRAELAASGASPLVEAVRGQLAEAPGRGETTPLAKTLVLPGAALGAEAELLGNLVRLLGGPSAVAIAVDDGRDIALALEVGLPVDPRREAQFLASLRGARRLVLAEGLLGRWLRPRLALRRGVRLVGLGEALLGLPAVRGALRATDLLVVEARAYHAEHERLVGFYDEIRRETSCGVNLDLQRAAVASGATSIQARHGQGRVDPSRQVGFVLAGLGGRRPERVVVEDPRDRTAYELACGVPVVHLAQLA